jgi:hypothetical protein
MQILLGERVLKYLAGIKFWIVSKPVFDYQRDGKHAERES